MSDTKLARLAACQHGLFTRQQALALGFTPGVIGQRVRSGAWEAVARGVYAIPGCPWTWRRKLMLAVLDVGPGAVVSHHAAAALHGFPGFRPGAPELTVVKGASRLVRWHVHETRSLAPRDRVIVDGIPVTSVLRTLFDLAAILSPRQLERLVDELLAAGRIKLIDLARRFVRHRRRGRRGTRMMARILEVRGPGYVPPASELEALLREVLESGGNPQPDWQAPHPAGPAEGRVDGTYHEAKLIIEADGRRWHSQVERMEADRHRDIAAVLAGYQTMRFMWADLVMRPEWVNDVVRRFLEQAGGAFWHALRVAPATRNAGQNEGRRPGSVRRMPMRTVIQLAESVRRGELKATEVLDGCLAAIEASNPPLNAFVHLDPELARDAADAVDATVARGDDPGPLAGVPFGVKDLEDCRGMPTTFGSLLFKGRPPVADDSIHVGRLRAAGGVPIGKTAAPEFGAVSYTASPALGVTRNPWNQERTPGGSSGGSAAAVAAGMVPMATASDGGGSTRIPGSFSGLPGFKASFGRIPNPPKHSSQTTCLGVLATTVADVARHLDVAAGPDDRDRTSLPSPLVSYEYVIERLDVAGLRAIWSVDLGFATVDPGVAAVTEAAAKTLMDVARLTAVDRAIELTDPVRVWLSSGAADLWADLEAGMWPDRADELDLVPRLGLQASETIAMPRWAAIVKKRVGLEAQVAALFQDVDVLLTPATAVPGFAAEGPMPNRIAGQDVHPAMTVPFTMLANLCWNPAISVPAGLTPEGLPIGLQIMGRHHADDVVLRLARIFEEASPWPRVAPGYEA